MRPTQVTDKHIEIIPEVFIENVKKALDFYGMKQVHLAQVTGLNPATVNKLLAEDESKRMKEPPLETVVRVCIALNLNLNIAVMQRVTSVHELFQHHLPKAAFNDENRELFAEADSMARTMYKVRGLTVDREELEGDYNFTSLVMSLFDIHVYARDVHGMQNLSMDQAINFMEQFSLAS